MLHATTALAITDQTQPQVHKQPVPEWATLLTQEQIDWNSSGEELDYLLFDSQIRLKERQSGRFLRFVARANSASAVKELSEITLRFDPSYQALIFHHVDLIRDGQRLNRLQTEKIKLIQQESELAHSIYSGSWTALLVIDDFRPGDSLDYSYSITGHNPVFGDRYFGFEQLTWSTPVNARRVSLTSDKPLQVRTNQPTDIHREITSAGEHRFRIELHHKKADLNEDRMPVEMIPTNYLEYSEYRNWAEVVQWATPLYEFPLDEPALEKSFAQVASSPNSDAERINELIRFVQNDVRYFGIEFGTNSHAPSAPHETLARRYGDCKDKTVLLVHLLRKMGVDASPALVSAETRSHIKHRLASPGAFDHVIVSYLWNGKRYWVDPTYTEQAGNAKTRSLPMFEQALLLKADSKKLVSIAAVHPEQQLSQVKIDEQLRLDEKTSEMDIHLQIEYEGWRADEVRYDIKSTTTDIYQKNIKEYFQKQFNEMELIGAMEKMDDIENNRLSLRFRFRAPRPHTEGAARSEYVMASTLMRDYVLKPAILDRKYPFRLLPDLVVSQNTKIIFPEHRKILWVSDLGQSDVKSPFFSVQRNATQNGNTLDISMEYRSVQSLLPPKDVQDYLKQSNAALEALVTVVWADQIGTSKDGVDKAKVKGLIEKLKAKKP
ncbi:DUF3857 domain-containing protein [Permianibacter aggregans]|uniref:Transglutaminase superfamily protein n=1 Tax=Permianibacter aggregans TaxID=1510150 RepID=A0A4R6UKK1_9GAMM|nr:DUF3857 domain-containing protein [Permianibacter aggregans]QGX39756.1 DUF3857 domain-containing protein [Permianibacter aggregans]TDQ47122.1 transglutaminase superfamily protein [Permianibacter aggregans]